MAVTFVDLFELPLEMPNEILVYGESLQHFGELWVPAEPRPGPLVILIHGGCWQNAYDLSHVRPAASALRSAGYVVWSIEYRRIGDTGGAWPGIFHDIGAAVDFAATLVGARGMLTNSVVLMGHSAGGHLALWAAARPGFPPAHPFYKSRAIVPDAVLGLAAITDLRGYSRGQSSCQQAVLELLGPVETKGSRYALTSPVELLPTGVPVTLMLASEDTIVPSSQAESFHHRAIRLGDRSTLYHVPGAGHFDLIHPGTPAWQAVETALREYA